MTLPSRRSSHIERPHMLHLDAVFQSSHRWPCAPARCYFMLFLASPMRMRAHTAKFGFKRWPVPSFSMLQAVGERRGVRR